MALSRSGVKLVLRKLIFLIVAFVVCYSVGGKSPRGFSSNHVSLDASIRVDELSPQKRYLLSDTDNATSKETTKDKVKTLEDKIKEEEEIESFLPDEVAKIEQENEPPPTKHPETKHIPKPQHTKHKVVDIPNADVTDTITDIGKSHRKHSSSPRTTSSSLFTTESPEVTSKSLEEMCTPPAYHEFPPDLFTHKQRSHGAIIFHFIVIIYMFYAVAVVCDDYFIASLEECCARLQLSEDVAGATFMAAGSSAPELFTAILGVLVAKGDVGTGTIVGSAVFNVLFVIGLCGIFAGRAVDLTWWPLFRDSSFYAFTVVILICIIFDSHVTWYESLIMLIIYSVYIVIMKYSNTLHLWFNSKLGIEEDPSSASIGILNQGDKKTYSSYVPFNNEIDECASQPVTARYHANNVAADESIREGQKWRPTLYEAALKMLMKPQFKPKTRFKAAAWRIMLEHENRKLEETRRKKLQPQVSLDSDSITKWRSKSVGSTIGLDETIWRTLPSREDGPLTIIKWVIRTPLFAILYYTIPDCRKEKWRKFFMLTLFMSITWTAVFSYIMVWMVTLVGYTLGIPDSIMGITFLAAGTSVPDAFASLIVARQGQGDMAVSNSIGSNVFDILIGLAFPWFMQTAMVEPGSIAVINSRGMVYSVVLLFLTIIITIGGIYLSHWQLTKRLGVVLLIVYCLFLTFSIMIEYNMFGFVNPPMCPD